MVRELDECRDVLDILNNGLNEADLLDAYEALIEYNGDETNILLNGLTLFRTVDYSSEEFEDNIERIVLDNIKELRDNMTKLIKEMEKE